MVFLKHNPPPPPRNNYLHIIPEKEITHFNAKSMDDKNFPTVMFVQPTQNTIKRTPNFALKIKLCEISRGI
jgi:hypothetical protein